MANSSGYDEGFKDGSASKLTDVELEAALTEVGIFVYGPDAERFEKMFAAAMKCRFLLSEEPMT